MKKIIFSSIIVVTTLLSCDKKVNLEGEFYCKECSMFKTLKIDSEVVSMGLMGNGKYYIKNNRLYIESYSGTITYEIIDKNTLKSVNSIVNEGELFKRKK